jgi:hypothetical protein
MKTLAAQGSPIGGDASEATSHAFCGASSLSPSESVGRQPNNRRPERASFLPDGAQHAPSSVGSPFWVEAVFVLATFGVGGWLIAACAFLF